MKQKQDIDWVKALADLRAAKKRKQGIPPWLWGILTLALQRLERKLWLACKRGVSLALGVAAVALFIVTRQPYAALLAFSFLIAKALFLKKCR
jgi:predicted lysophospholipase L1 biosynthesis ABC-type transport system permease subunit